MNGSAKGDGMNDEYHGSVQKELIAERKSFSAKYASLFLGEKN